MAKKNASTDSLLQELASRFEQIKLDGIVMMESACRRDPSLQVDHLPDVGNQAIQIHSQIDVAAKRISVLIGFRLSIFHASEPRAEPAPISMRTAIVLSYQIPPTGIDTQGADRFARTVAVMQAWPYWREFIQSSSARMGLPTFNVAPPDLGSVVAAAGPTETANSKPPSRMRGKPGRKRR